MTTPLTTHKLGLAEGLRIQRYHDRADWRAQIEAIEDAEVRAVAAAYLRDIWRRMQAQAAACSANEVAPCTLSTNTRPR